MEETRALVTIDGNTPYADSRQIARNLDIEHHNFYAMVKKYQDEVETDFGKVLFISEPLPSGQTQKYAKLTEDQSYVYLAYSQNTEQARKCKRLLVKAFAEARAKLAQVPAPDIAGILSSPTAVDQLLTELHRVQYHRKQEEQHIKRASHILLFPGANLVDEPVQAIEANTFTPDEQASRLENEIMRRIPLYTKHYGDAPSATGIHDYIKWATRKEIIDVCDDLVKRGILTVERTSHTVRYMLPEHP